MKCGLTILAKTRASAFSQFDRPKATPKPPVERDGIAADAIHGYS